MTLEEIQELIKFVAKSGATEVDLEFEDVKISIKSPPKKRRGQPDEPIAIIQQATPIQTVAASVITETVPQSKAEDDSKHVTIKSSMIGTFYRSSGPDKDAFVNVGDEIKEGDPICIIEAMKLFNEIESEIAGTITKICVQNGSPVEFGQELFLVDVDG